MPDDTEAVIRALYQQARRDPEQRLNSPSVDDDFRFPCATWAASAPMCCPARQSGRGAARHPVRPARPGGAGHPPQVLSFARRRQGLVLVTGPAGGGKSTTLACMIDAINRERGATSSRWRTPSSSSTTTTAAS
ncbi:MAG: ATPase, T2SS/T4P/T4SS family [Gemmiger formicilis]|uniref:ATPase, T2SS/T4P/T4SS family n=1 Tax=Gemmiger formicilis TaxID=745368 RepID=UPI0039911494